MPLAVTPDRPLVTTGARPADLSRRGSRGRLYQQNRRWIELTVVVQYMSRLPVFLSILHPKSIVHMDLKCMDIHVQIKSTPKKSKREKSNWILDSQNPLPGLASAKARCATAICAPCSSFRACWPTRATHCGVALATHSASSSSTAQRAVHRRPINATT